MSHGRGLLGGAPLLSNGLLCFGAMEHDDDDDDHQ